MSKTICLDFDGVMNTYTGWKGEDELYEPREGLPDFLSKLKGMGVEVVINSTRPALKIQAWLERYNLASLVDRVTDRKPPAVAYLDDRAVCFNGVFDSSLVDQLIDFKAHWESSKQK